MGVEASNDLCVSEENERATAAAAGGAEARSRRWTRGLVGGNASHPAAPAVNAPPPPAAVAATPTSAAPGRQEQQPQQSGEAARKQQQKKSQEGRAPAVAVATVFNARFVTWNLQRKARGKAPVIERLIRDLDFPSFIALQETADVETSISEIRAIGQLGYNILSKKRNRDSCSKAAKHGGAMLLVHKSVTANEYVWPEADAWSAGCETISAVVSPPNGGDKFIVSSVYVAGRGTDAESFGRLLDSAKDNQIILGDLNAQLPGPAAGVSVGTAYRKRGELLERFLADRGWFAPTPTGSSRPATGRTPDGRTERLAAGTNYDHILVGCDVLAQIPNSEPEAYVFDGAWPSDHNPMTWGAEMSIHGPADGARSWMRGIAWHDVLPHHRERFNVRFRAIVGEERAAAPRRMDMGTIERALVDAARSTLPRTRAPAAGPVKCPPLYDTTGARQHVAAAAAKYGDGDAGRISRAATEARRMTLATHATIEPNPSSVWNFIRRWFGFNDNSSLRPPLETEDPKRRATTKADRVATLGQQYMQVHGDPDSSSIKAQQQLAEAIAEIDKVQKLQPHRRNRGVASAGVAPTPVSPTAAAQSANAVSVTELRACLAEFQTGKASDFVGVKAEHLKLLDDRSLGVMLPFFDRCISRAAVPAHWRTAVVTPVPKPKRDLAIRRNWRPVSVTALLCRACEAIVHNRIQHRIEQNGGERRQGKSQFGFRRGVGTSLPLAGLSMFIRDGQQQRFGGKRWNEHRGTGRSVDGEADDREYHHDTLLVCVDASDAFCRALPAMAVRRLLGLGLPTEARWVAQLLTDRSFKVRDGDVYSNPFRIARGVPQGSIIGPLLWSLIVEDLIVRCEAECRIVTPGCVAVPIIFADDINFAIRGFNPSSMVAKANRLMAIVDAWSKENDIPMAKLQASWISTNKQDRTYVNWLPRDGEVILNDKVRCTPGVQPIKILGVTYDSDFAFSTHVDNIVEECSKYKGLLWSMCRSVKAEKLAVIYKGLVLSRLTYAAEAWYPFIRRADADRLQRLHRDCCFAITGCRSGSHGDSVIYEAGFYPLDVVMRDELVKLGDKLRRYPASARGTVREQVFGPEWVVALFRDEPMPTAPPRMAARARVQPTETWPAARFVRREHHEARSAYSRSLRDMGIRLNHGDARRRNHRAVDASLRPMAPAFPYAPQELRVFDDHVKFITESPGLLVKPENFEQLSEEQKLPFRQANLERIDELVRANPGRTLFIFTDGARREGAPGRESCAGAFVVCKTATPHGRADVLYKKQISANPIACTYTAELLSIYDALTWVNKNRPRLRKDYDRIVLITDSKSALESMQTTWLRRIADLEQRACRLLFDLASGAEPFDITLAFIFSHTGGCPGNELADKLASDALSKHGKLWRSDEVWNIDSTRRIQRGLHDGEHAKMLHVSSSDDDDSSDGEEGEAARRAPKLPFRARNIPGKGKGRVAPSGRLPVALSRADEILLFRARVGTMPDVGGFLHNRPEPCPLCGAANVLGRGGTAIDHLLRCRRGSTMGAALLWTDPIKAVNGLRAIWDAAMETGQCSIQLRQPCGRASGHDQQQQPALQQSATPVAGSLHLLGE